MNIEIIKILLINGGAVAAIIAVMFLIKELKGFKNGEKEKKDFLSERLQNIEDNHLHSLNKDMEQNQRDHSLIIKKLEEIKEVLIEIKTMFKNGR